jgi:DNA-binding CsgD family transcriptional regulator/nucleoside-triphosphatase THEP1
MPTSGDLVGRRTELSRLIRALTEDTARAVVVCGDPGVGKTSLIDHLDASARSSGWRVVRILGVESEDSYTLGGLNQLVFSLKESLAGLDEQNQTALKPVLCGDANSSVSVLPLAAAVLDLLSVAAQNQPLMLVADDVHWMDSVSAEVLSAVGRRLADPRVQIVAGRRALHESAFSQAGWAELPLGPLSDADSASLLDRTGGPLPAATKTAILTAAAGNPLALAELPRSAAEFDFGAGAPPLTERLVEVFGGRAKRLDAASRADLLRAALDGSTAGPAAADRSRYAIRNGEPAVAMGLLVVNPLGQYVFRHPLVRAAVVHQASLHERRSAHRDLAGLYPDVLFRRATHLAGAATGPDQDVADLLGEAAQLSLRLGGIPAAIEWLREAAGLSNDPKRRTALLAEAVFVTTRAGRIDEARELLGNAEADATQFALAALADCYQAIHTDGEALSTHRRLLEALRSVDELDEQVVNRLVNLLLYITGYADDDRLHQLTNAAVAAVKLRVAPAVLLYHIGVDDIASTAKGIRSTLAGYAAFLSEVPARYVLMMSYPAYCTDAMAEFRAPLRTAFTQVSAHGASLDAIEGGRVVLLDLMASGQWEQAEEIGAQCLEMAAGLHGSELLRQTLMADLGVLAACRGDLETARRYATEVTAWSQPRGMNMMLRTAQRIAVRVAFAEGDYEAAYQSAIRISPPGEFPRKYIQVGDQMLDMIEALIHTGRLEDARAHVEEAVRLNLAEVSPRVAALILATTAMTAPDTEAEELYQSALDHPGIVEFPFERARIALAQGMSLRRMRRYNEARVVLGSAAEGFDRIGARPWAERARAELRASGATVKQSRGETIPLSAQERRIADLAASGKTNKEIAVQLNLSPRTVEAHLSRAFRKLGITRRAALSQALLEQDSELCAVGEEFVEI